MNPLDIVTINPDILGGTPVFKNTHVPVRTLFEYLAANYSLEEFLEAFPSVSRDAATQIGKGDYVKDRDALFANETVDSLFQRALVQQSK
jgi:uncharacterized protein (DUF433 family)